MKSFFLIIIILITSCSEPIDIDATIDARALRIAMDNIDKISTATPQPMPTVHPSATPQPTPTVVPLPLDLIIKIAEEKAYEAAYKGDLYVVEEILPTLVPILAPIPTPQPTATPQPTSTPQPMPEFIEGSKLAYNIYQENKSKVLMLSIGNSTGTGWVIEDGWIITNEHVVGNNKFVLVHFSLEDNISGSTTIQGEVFGIDSKRDLAAIKIDHNLEPIKTRIADVNDIGRQVVTLGYSAGNSGVPSSHSGIISYVKTAGSTLTFEKGSSYYKDEPLNEKVSIIVFDAAADPGDSGGPILDDNGVAIGMVYGFLESTGGKRTTGQQMGTNIASINQVWEELKSGNNTSFK